MTAPFLSVIIPAHNEERRLPESLAQVVRFLRTSGWTWEVLVVENGSSDGTFAVAQDFAARNPGVRALQLDLPGKGRAVRTGMLAALGQYRFMCDADLSMPITELPRFLPPSLTGAEIVLASREAAGAVRYAEPAYRHLGGRLINLTIRLLALPGLQDTQCGFKCFTAAAAEDLFGCQTIPGWSFDIELLYVARLRGYRIAELPIPWTFNPESKLRVVQDALQMVLDILAVRRNARRGVYDAPARG